MTAAPPTVTCTRCSQPLDPIAAFCSSCGAPGPAHPSWAPRAPHPPSGPPPATTPEDHRTVHAHGWLLVVAAGALIAGFFLPWITARIPFTGEITFNGADMEAWKTLGGAAVVALLALQTVTSHPAGTHYTWPLALLAALGTTLFSAASYQDVTEQLAAAHSQGIGAGYGIGLWLIAAGILLSLIAIVGGWGATRRALKWSSP